ncbi:MAG: DUF1743 domain-containing protein [Candidatus Bathyarchaeota archaeon]|nr:MAG: DUF1743 domain-containing protein [Candidatus Bathyarchaeota archaeon]
MATIHIGFDDTDSPAGGCTTYIAALLVEKLQKMGVIFKDYPNLVRLNPNVPWKTRGNGALCLRIECNTDLVEEIFDIVTDTVEKNSQLGVKNTDPGVVFLRGDTIPREIRIFARETIQSIVTLKHALKLLRRFGAEALGYGSRDGLIGSLAAVGETLEGDHTFEVIAYRTPKYLGTFRQVDPTSVREMDKKMRALTFNNVDPERRRVLITPRGPDPILYGIRGETPEAVVKAHEMIESSEPVERWAVFRTNHGTDAHLKRAKDIKEIKPYKPVIARGFVASAPRLVPKRHRIFSLKDESGEIDCAAYEPTGTLRKIARNLIASDQVEVCGGVRPASKDNPITVNLEKIRILKLAPKLKLLNPECPKCGKRMKSKGAKQGFKCWSCGFNSSVSKKIAVEEERGIRPGLYIASPRSQRHLTKPTIRYGKEKTGKLGRMIDYWHSL